MRNNLHVQLFRTLYIKINIIKWRVYSFIRVRKDCPTWVNSGVTIMGIVVQNLKAEGLKVGKNHKCCQDRESK